MATLTGRLTFVFFCFDFFSVDHSRVRLATVDGMAGSDYINANFCDVSVTLLIKFSILLTVAYLPPVVKRR